MSRASDKDIQESEKLSEKPVVEQKDKKENLIPYFLTEAILVVGVIPTVLYFFVGVINGLLLLIEQDEYLTCIAQEKVNKILAGKSQDDVSDMIEWHLIGSTIVAWTMIILYSNILFIICPYVYKWSGIAYVVAMILSLAFHCVAAVWLSSNKCDDTSLYGMAMFNTVFFFIYLLFMTVFILVLFLKGVIAHNKQNSKKKDDDEKIEESEERMLPEKDNNEDKPNSNTGDEKTKKHEEDQEESDLKEKKTLDGKKEENKEENKDGDLEEEDIY